MIQLDTKKPHFEFISKKKHPEYNDSYVYKKGTRFEIRWYAPNIYYTTIQSFSQKFETLASAIENNFLFN